MTPWTEGTKEELAAIIKDWLKQQGRTQADLSKSLQALSSRMPALIEVLERDYQLGGLQKVAAHLCSVEKEWNGSQEDPSIKPSDSDPFGQLDLILEEIREDCNN